MSETNENFVRVVAYVDAAADLVEMLKSDLKRDNKISVQTILAMNKLVIAANNMDFLVGQIDKTRLQIN